MDNVRAISLEGIRNKMFLATFSLAWIKMSPQWGLKYNSWSLVPLGWAHETWNVPAGSRGRKLILME